MKNIFSVSRNHLGKLAFFILIAGGTAAYTASDAVREQTHLAWSAALQWAGLTTEAVDTSQIYWCPMHPQIKSHKENAVCPICNMALVELEGGTVEVPQHLTLTAQQVQQAGVVTQPVVRRAVYREIDTTGRIDYDERRYAGISSWIKGKSRIDKLHVNFTGDYVKKGQVVAEIYSPELITAQQELLIALQSNRLAGSDTRTNSIVASTREALIASARQKLLYQGMTSEQVDRLITEGEAWERIPVIAPISGTVIERHVQEGQYVNEGDWLFHLADLSALWLFIDVYEDELPLVDVGMPVEIKVDNFRGRTFTGNVTYIEPKVRPNTRTVPIRIDVANTEQDLLPGMFARAVLRREWPSLLAIPENAVLWSGKRSVAIVKEGESKFRPREVNVGRKWLRATIGSPGEEGSLVFGEDQIRYHEVLSGLRPGDEVVTAGAFLLNAESQFQNVLAKMLPPQSEPATLEQVVGPPVAQDIRRVLEAYFAFSEALADDELQVVPARLTGLDESSAELTEAAAEFGSDELKADAQRFHDLVASSSAEPIVDAVDARTRFGRISHELTKLLANHGGKTLFGREVYQFECGMAKVGYERWLWWSPEIHNPYMGHKMLTCGKKLDVLEP